MNDDRTNTGDDDDEEPVVQSDAEWANRAVSSGPVIKSLGANDALSKIADTVTAALAPEIAKISSRVHAQLFAAASTRAILATHTEDFLRNVRLQIPVLDFSRLITPETRAALAAMSGWLKRLIPANVRGLHVAQWERLIKISEEQRIGIAWVPREEVLQALLNAETEQERAQTIDERAEDILDDCIESLRATSHSSLVELGNFAHDAISAHREGHTAAAQALATNVLDTGLEQYHVAGVKGMLAECKRLQARDKQATTLLEMRLRIATSGIPRSYQSYKYGGGLFAGIQFSLPSNKCASCRIDLSH